VITANIEPNMSLTTTNTDSVAGPGSSSFTSRFAADFEVVGILGTGGYGIVFEVRDKLAGIPYAIKRIPISSSEKSKAKRVCEVQMHANLYHEYIVRYNSAWFEEPPPGWQALFDLELEKKLDGSIDNSSWTPSDSSHLTSSSSSSSHKKGDPAAYLYIMMERCEGTLRNWMMQQQPRVHQEAVNIFLQICSGLAHIHRKGLIHRDLKPSNIYMTGNLCIKIGDFGLTTAERGNMDNQVLALQRPAMSAGSLTADVGTSLYMALEQCSRQTYDHKVDIYSLGVILLELLVPFATDMERCRVLDKAKNGELPPELIANPELEFFATLLERILHKEANLRPEAEEIRNFCLTQDKR
jgi:serine/threonine protein kinase